MQTIRVEKNINIVDKYYVIVAGGGVAGVAAAIAIDDKKAVGDIDVSKLQGILAEQNVMIHFDDSLVNRELGPESDAEFEKYDHI